MSKYVVKSKRPLKALPLVAVETLSYELQVVVPELTASKPMPLDFSKTWDAAKDKLGEVIVKNQGDALSKVAAALNRRFTVPNKLISKLNSNKRVAAFMITSSVTFTALGMGLSGWVLGFDTVYSTGMPVFLAFGYPSLIFSILPSGIAWGMDDSLHKKFLIPVLDSFDAGYEQRVIQWARARYGVIIPRGVWVAPSDRVSEDIVHLGTQGAQNIYCFKSEQGWIIGYRDGTELPVLVEQKELVRV